MDASSILSGYGLAGLVIAALSTAVVKLYMQNQALHTEWREWMRASNEALEESNKTYMATVEKLANISDRMTNSVQPPQT